MSRDYKAKPRAPQRRSGSSLLVGILVGLVLGLVVALGVAWYINKMPSPFTASRTTPPTPPAKAEPPKAAPAQAAKLEEKAAKAEEKPRFDFYKILPGSEEATPDKAAKEPAKASPPGSTPNAKEAFFLQAGAFQSAPDADNMKARLALLGVEAAIETTSLPDKGVMHRVRIGPYTSVEELNRTRDTLKQNGVQTSLVKAREPER
jgi:cell division protein FtsN